MNHALNADYHHTLERCGLDPSGNEATAARAHARQAGREAAIAGNALGDVSGHISRFPVLSYEYQKGHAEAEKALMLGSSSKFLSACLNARSDLDKAIQERDLGGIYDAAQSIFSVAADNPDSVLPFFSDTPEVNSLIEAAATWRQAMQELQAAANRHAEWEASLPTAAQLEREVETSANGEGKSFDFEGYTLWHEPEHGGWSLTNAYGVDNCAFLASEAHFQSLLNAVKRGEEIGPVPPGCEPPDDDDDHPDYDAMIACTGAANSVSDRLMISK